MNRMKSFNVSKLLELIKYFDYAQQDSKENIQIVSLHL